MPETETFSIRILSALLEKIKEEAKKRDRSVNYIINETLKEKFEPKQN